MSVSKINIQAIRPGPDDADQLTAIWEAAVRASHLFLDEQDIVRLRQMVREQYLFQMDKLFVAVINKTKIGFLGLVRAAMATPARVEMLFVHPDHHGQGIGMALLNMVTTQYMPLELDVNEQNPKATAFYRQYGFVITGRSDLDNQGYPFPLLHMRLDAQIPGC